MPPLVYSMIASLDGYVADEDGRFEWAEPDEEVHRFANELEREACTYLYGRRMYETMRVWELPEFTDGPLPYTREYAEIWQAADKIVYSRTLEDVSTQRTTLVRAFDPDEVRRMKREAASSIFIAGPTLAAEAFRAGLVDEVGLFIAPVLVGGGLAAFPRHVAASLKLIDERRFANGFRYLRYEVAEYANAAID